MTAFMRDKITYEFYRKNNPSLRRDFHDCLVFVFFLSHFSHILVLGDRSYFFTFFLMRYLYLFLAFLAFGFSLQMVSATTVSTACTMEYAPVCGMVDVQCIMAPCYPVRTDFSNLCMAQAAGARDITGGTCIMSESPTPVEWINDVHGCLRAAGYRWSHLAKQCLRAGESRVRILTIAPETKPCVFGMMNTECLQMRVRGKWMTVYGGIDGFDFVPWYTYRLRVLETRVDSPPADGRAIEYSLLKVISKRVSPVKYDEVLLWDWYMIGYNDISILALSSIRAQDLTLSITKDRFSAKICNSISGKYTLLSGVFQTSYMMSTKMACQNTLITTMEWAWDLDGATYTIASARQMAGATGPSIWLTITTKAGNVFTYTR